MYAPFVTTPMDENPLNPTPRAAASVVLLRDGAQGLEVFLLQRHPKAPVLGGAHVFPGGKLDAQDCALDFAQHTDAPHSTLQQRLGEPHTPAATAAGLFVAALRETLEECGVCFARSATGQAPTPAQCQAAALGLRAGHSLPHVLHSLGLRLNTQALQPWSRWITPLPPNAPPPAPQGDAALAFDATLRARFDTRFFLAALPAGQSAQHDAHETIASLWRTPQQALRAYWQQQLTLAPPQIMGLVHLAQHRSVRSVLQEAQQRTPPLIQPQAHWERGQGIVCYPGDARHPESSRVLPGPTRLVYRNQRFEPEAGLCALTEGVALP